MSGQPGASTRGATSGGVEARLEAGALMEEKDGGGEGEKKKQVIVCIDASKRETHHAGNGYKKLFRRLRSHNYKPMSNKEDLCAQLLSTVDVLVIGAPRERFTADELRDVKAFVANGGSLIVLASPSEFARIWIKHSA